MTQSVRVFIPLQPEIGPLDAIPATFLEVAVSKARCRNYDDATFPALSGFAEAGLLTEGRQAIDAARRLGGRSARPLESLHVLVLKDRFDCGGTGLVLGMAMALAAAGLERPTWPFLAVGGLDDALAVVPADPIRLRRSLITAGHWGRERRPSATPFFVPARTAGGGATSAAFAAEIGMLRDTGVDVHPVATLAQAVDSLAESAGNPEPPGQADRRDSQASLSR